MSPKPSTSSIIPVNEPVLSPNALTYVTDAIESGWISSAGSYIKRFEDAYASWIGASHAITVTNGTAALHLALAALGVGPGDEVIIPDLTIISCALAVLYTGATPVFVDVDPVTFTLDPSLLERAITNKTKVVMPVHLYGHPADMDPIIAIAQQHHVYVVEDAAEAHGALYKGRPVGTLGDIGCFSFYANKIITTGEGGMVVTNDASLMQRMRLLKDLAHSPTQRFYHEHIGFNYRMTNLAAAVGLAQLETVDTYLKTKYWMAKTYHTFLQGIPYLELPTEAEWAKSVYWMYAITLSPESPITKNDVRKKLLEHTIDTRDFFYPMHTQPILKQYTNAGMSFPVSVSASDRGFYLPSGLKITELQMKRTADALRSIMSQS